MTEQEILWIATGYAGNGYSIQQMYDGFNCYHLEDEECNKIKEKIADYMVEIEELGTTAFYEKYKEFKLY